MAYIGYDGPDVVSKAMLDNLAAICQHYQTLKDTLAAADGDKDALFKNWMETSDNPQAEKLRQTIANATAKLRELAEKNVPSAELTEEDRTRITVEMDEYTNKIKAGYQVANGLLENITEDPENVKKALDSIENPVQSNRGRKPGSTGSNLPRVSVNVTITGGNLTEPRHFESLSAATKVLNTDVETLQHAFAKAAGVAHANIKDVDVPLEFGFKSHENGAEYTVATTPKPRGKNAAAATPAAPAVPEPAVESESTEAA
jgi:hypothetical protein